MNIDEDYRNAAPSPTIEAPCICSGLGCSFCGRTGTLTKKSCRRCGGTGSEARLRGVPGQCRDCKGAGWRDIDNVKNWD